MKTWEQKDMSGNCHKQDLSSKTKEEQEWMAPWSGDGMIDGQMYWINMYDNVSQAGNNYRRMTFKRKSEGAAITTKTVGGYTGFSKKPESEEKPKAFKADDDLPW